MEDTMYHEDVHTQSSGGGFAMGLMFGTLLGAAAALMFAPFAGNETRDRLRAQAERFRDKTTETYGRVSKTVDDVVKKAGKAYSDVAETAQTEATRSDFRA